MGHRLPDDQMFQIARADAPLAGRHGLLQRKDLAVGVVHAPDRRRSLPPGMFQQGALFQDERAGLDTSDAPQGRRIEPLRREGPTHAGRDQKIGIESRIHRPDEPLEAVEHRQQDNHRRDGHRHGRDAQARDQVDDRPGLRREEITACDELRCRHGFDGWKRPARCELRRGAPRRGVAVTNFSAPGRYPRCIRANRRGRTATREYSSAGCGSAAPRRGE